MNMATGLSLHELLDLDLVSFDALAESVLKITYREKFEAAWTAMVSAQGDKKAMEEWVKPWKLLAGITQRKVKPVQKADTSKLVDDQAIFLKKFKRGI